MADPLLRVFSAIAGVAIIAIVLWDAFETIVLPRRVMRRYRVARAFYRATWKPWRTIGQRMEPKRRERWFSFFGPLSLLALLGTWATSMLFAFALLHFGLQTKVSGAGGPVHADLLTYVYLSGETLFTLGLGDVTPNFGFGRGLVVIEAGTGFGFLALVIGYFPILYQAFSRREAQISLLDARAGSPPTATELLRRNLEGEGEQLRALLADCERWSAELMESHLSYPVLCYFRSQHDNESWLAALTAILDACGFVIAATEGKPKRQAEWTFAIARHAVVDLSQVFFTPPLPPRADRLPAQEFERLVGEMCSISVCTHRGSHVETRLRELRSMYEPYVYALSEYLEMPMPAWRREDRPDNWQTSAWGRITSGTPLTEELKHDDHV